MPSAESQSIAVQRIREIYADNYKAATNQVGKAALAKKLLEQAGAIEGDQAARFSLFREAYAAAVSAGNYPLAKQATISLTDEYAIDTTRALSSLIVKFGETVTATDERRTIASDAIKVATAAKSEKRFAEAKAVASIAEAQASKIRDVKLKSEAQALLIDLAAREKEWLANQSAIETLKNNPDDGAANTAYGKYLCLEDGDWTRGLKHLAKGSDEAWKKAAEGELVRPKTAAERVAVADAWWSAAESASDVNHRAILLEKSAAWYKMAISGLTGLDRARATKRIEDATAAIAPQERQPVTPRPKLDARLFVGKWNLLDPDGKVGGTFALAPNGTAQKTYAPNEAGQWRVVDQEVRIVWSDGWRDVLRPLEGGVLKIAFSPASDKEVWDGEPANTQPAVKQ